MVVIKVEKDVSTLLQRSILCVGKDNLQKIKRVFNTGFFFFANKRYRMITLNRRKTLSNKHKPYRQTNSNHEDGNFCFLAFLE